MGKNIFERINFVATLFQLNEHSSKTTLFLWNINNFISMEQRKIVEKKENVLWCYWNQKIFKEKLRMFADEGLSKQINLKNN